MAGPDRRDTFRVLSLVLDALFPPLCAGCRSERAAFCATCRSRSRAARTLPVGGLSVRATGRYAGALRRAVLAFKAGRRDVGRALGAMLAAEATLPRRSILVPVPTTARRRAERGFDQSALLAEAIGEERRLTVLAALRQSAGDAQRGRSRMARLQARGRFACTLEPARLAGARVVLVDDVVTTGATLADCARTLRGCGASVDVALVLAYA